MPQYSYSDITAIKLMPIFRLWLIAEPAPTGWSIEDTPAALIDPIALQLTHNEIESSVTINPIVRRTMHGGDRQIGQTLQAQIFTSVADITGLHNMLSNFVGKRISAKIQFGGYRESPGIVGMTAESELPGYQTRYLYLTKFDAWDAQCEMNYRIEPAEFRMRTVITLTAQLPAGTGMAGLLTDNDTYYW